MVRKVVVWLVVAFIIFYMITKPTQAAGLVKSAGSGLRQVASQMATFFTNLTK